MPTCASSGMEALTAKPPSGRGAGVERAAVERYALGLPDHPFPVPSPRTETPSFRTATSSRAGAYRSTTSTGSAPHALRVRHLPPARSGTPPARCRRERIRGPSVRSSTGSPASCTADYALDSWTPASARATGRRRTPAMHKRRSRRPTRARSAGSTAGAAGQLRRGRAPGSTLRPHNHQVTLFARMSCSSRAIRNRSCTSAASRSRSWSRSRRSVSTDAAAASRRRRTYQPSAHAPVGTRSHTRFDTTARVAEALCIRTSRWRRPRPHPAPPRPPRPGRYAPTEYAPTSSAPQQRPEGGRPETTSACGDSAAIVRPLFGHRRRATAATRPTTGETRSPAAALRPCPAPRRRAARPARRPPPARRPLQQHARGGPGSAHPDANSPRARAHRPRR